MVFVYLRGPLLAGQKVVGPPLAGVGRGVTGKLRGFEDWGAISCDIWRITSISGLANRA